MVAKIASDVGKPDGLLEVLPEGVQEFLAPLPVERLWGVGKKSKSALNNLGIHKIGDEFNLRIRYPFPHLKVNVGYAYFKPGSYTTKFLRGGDSHFAYVEVSAVLLEKAN